MQGRGRRTGQVPSRSSRTVPPREAPRTEVPPSAGRCGPRSRPGIASVPSPRRASRGRTALGPPVRRTGSRKWRHGARTRSRAAPAPPGPAARTTDRGPSRHPEPQDRGDSAERPKEELALLRILRDELHVRAHLTRDAREVFDELAVLEDGEGAAVLRTRRQLAGIIDGLLALPIAVRAPQFETDLAKSFGDQQRVDRAESQGVPDLVLSVGRESAVRLPDLLHEALDEGLLPHQVEAAQDLARLLDELPQAIFVRVPGVEERREHLFLHLVVEKVSRRELFLRVAGPADDDPLKVGPIQERLRHQISDLLVPLVDRDVVASLESAGALSAHPVLRRDLRLEVLDHLDALSPEQAERRLAPVDHEEPVDVLLREHLVERLRVELRIASVEERRDGLGRLEDERDHLSLVRADLFVPGEDDEAVRRRHLVRLKALHRRLDRLRHMLAGARALDVRRLRLLSP